MTTQTPYQKLERLINAAKAGLRFTVSAFSTSSATLFEKEFIGGLYLARPQLSTKKEPSFTLTGTSYGNPFILDQLVVTLTIDSSTGQILSATAIAASGTKPLFNDILPVTLIKYTISLNDGKYTLNYQLGLDILSALSNLATLMGLADGQEFTLKANIISGTNDQPASMVYELGHDFSLKKFGNYSLPKASISLQTEVSWAYDDPTKKTGKHPIATNAILLTASTTLAQKTLNLSSRFIDNTDLLSFWVDVQKSQDQKPALLTFNDLLSLVPNASLQEVLPASMPFLDDFGLQALTVSVGLNPVQLSGCYVSLATQNLDWHVLPGIISLKKIEANFGVLYDGENASIDATVLGNFQLANQYPFTISGSYPQYIFRAFSAWSAAEAPNLNDILNSPLANGAGIVSPFSQGKSPSLEYIDLTLDAANRAFDANIIINPQVSLSFGSSNPWFSVAQLGFSLSYLQAHYSAQLYGQLSLGDGESQVDLYLSASYDSAKEQWQFDGSVQNQPTFTLSGLSGIIGFQSPSWFKDNSLSIKMLSLSYTKPHTGAPSYTFGLNAIWQISIPNINADAQLEADVQLQKEGSGSLSGSVSATANFYGCALQLGMSLNGATKVYSMSVEIAENLKVTGQYDTSSKTASLTFDRTPNLGEVLNFLIKTAEPGMELILSAPWDLLSELSIPEGTTLKYDFKNKSISIEFPIDFELLLVSLDHVSITYVPAKKEAQGSKGSKSQVLISLEGQFAGEPFNPGWDALRPQDAPQVPGKAAPFELKYLGLGQHVVPKNLDSMNTVSEAIHGLSKAFSGADNSPGNPLSGTGLKFDANAGWLIGANFSIMDIFEMGFIFMDPELYGMMIAVKSGPSAKPFGGLQFEILYKKVNDTTGMYYTHLTLPTIMRHLEFGEVSITLPGIKLWIYTDGSFKIDIGFPYNNNWNDSFGLEIFPFVGMGGLYFAKLEAADVSSLPDTQGNGSFGTVIEFGLAFRVGVGKNIEEGILSAGVSLTVAGLFQGMFTYYHPKNGGEKFMYFNASAMLAIIGKVYGAINFAIVSARFDVTAVISARATFISYQPVLINFEASVSVELTVSIHLLFTIHIHFSYSTTITQSFTIGNASTPPWQIGPGAPPSALSAAPLTNFALVGAATGDNTASLLQMDGDFAVPDLHPELLDLKEHLLTFDADVEQSDFEVSGTLVGAGDINLLFSPHYTTSGGKAQAILTTYIDSYGPDDPDKAENSFSKLALGCLQWLMTALLKQSGSDLQNINQQGGSQYLNGQSISSAQLQELADYFTAHLDQPFSWAAVRSFIQGFFSINLEQPADISNPNTYNGTVFPMLPSLEIALPAKAVTYGDVTLSQGMGQYSDPMIFPVSYNNQLLVFSQKNDYRLMCHVLKDGEWTSKELAKLKRINRPPQLGFPIVFEGKVHYFFFRDALLKKDKPDLISEFQYDGEHWTLIDHAVSERLYYQEGYDEAQILATIYRRKLVLLVTIGRTYPYFFQVADWRQKDWELKPIELEHYPWYNPVPFEYEGLVNIIHDTPRLILHHTRFDGKIWTQEKVLLNEYDIRERFFSSIVFKEKVFLVISSRGQYPFRVLTYNNKVWQEIDLSQHLKNVPKNTGYSEFNVHVHDGTLHIPYGSREKQIVDLTFDGETWNYLNLNKLLPDSTAAEVSNNWPIATAIHNEKLCIIYITVDKGSPFAHFVLENGLWSWESIVTADQQKTIAFNNDSPQTAYTPEEVSLLQEYMDLLKVQNQTGATTPQHAADTHSNAGRALTTTVLQRTSTAQVIFMDFITMMARQVVSASQEVYKAWTVNITAQEQLSYFLSQYGITQDAYSQILFANRQAQLSTSYIMKVANVSCLLAPIQGSTTLTDYLTTLISNNGYGSLTPNDIVAANPGINWPGMSDDPSAVYGATVDIPAFQQASGSGSNTTLLATASYYHLDINELIRSQLNVANVMDTIFKPGQSISLSNLQEMTLSELNSALQSKGTYQNLSGMVARFMLHGLQLPTPDEVKQAVEDKGASQLIGLYKLTQQQVGVSQLALGDVFNLSVSTSPDYQLSNLHISNNSYALSTSDINAIGDMNSSFNSLMNFDGLTLPALFNTQPKHFVLSNNISVTTPQPFGGGDGPSSLWKLDPHLVEILVQNGSLPFALNLQRQTPQPPGNTTPSETYMPATLLKFKVRRVEAQSAAGAFLPGIYEIHSVGNESLHLLQSLETTTDSEVNCAFRLMYPDQPIRNGQETPKKLVDGGCSNQQSSPDLFIIQSNLSQISDPTLQKTVPVTSSEVNQSLTRLLLEAAVVHTGGYYMYYQNPLTKQGLPDHLFSEKQPDAEVILVVTFGASADDQTLSGYHNYITYQGTVDSNADSFYLIASSSLSSLPVELEQKLAMAPPGTAGFEYQKPAVTTQNNPTTDSTIENLFHLISYNLASSSVLKQSSASQPMGPLKPQNNNATGENGTDPNWHYQAMVSVFPWLITQPAASPAYLPQPVDNPYNPIGQEVAFSLSWVDIYGNELTTSPQTAAQQTLFYTDPIVQLSEWPQLKAHYSVSQQDIAAQQVNIVTTFTFNYAPFAPHSSGDTAHLKKAMVRIPQWVKRARNCLEKYKHIYYQYTASTEGDTPDMMVQMGSTIGHPDQLGAPFGNTVSTLDLQAFINQIKQTYVYLKGIAESKLLITAYQIKERSSIDQFKRKLGIGNDEATLFELVNEGLSLEIKTNAIVNRPCYAIDSEKPMPLTTLKAYTIIPQTATTISAFIAKWSMDRAFFNVLNVDLAQLPGSTEIATTDTVFVGYLTETVEMADITLNSLAAKYNVSLDLLTALNPDLPSGPIAAGTVVNIALPNASVQDWIVPTPENAPFRWFSSNTAIPNLSSFTGISDQVLSTLNPGITEGQLPANTPIILPVRQRVLKALGSFNLALLRALNPGTALSQPLESSTSLLAPNDAANLDTQAVLNATWLAQYKVIAMAGTSPGLFMLFNPSPAGTICKIPENTIVNVPTIASGGPISHPRLNDLHSVCQVSLEKTQLTSTAVAGLPVSQELFTKYNPMSSLVVPKNTPQNIPCSKFTVLDDNQTLAEIATNIAFNNSAGQLTTWLTLLNPEVSGTLTKGQMINIPVPQPLTVSATETLNTGNNSIFQLVVKTQASRKPSVSIASEAPADVKYHSSHINPGYTPESAADAINTLPLLSLKSFAKGIETAMPGFRVATTSANETQPGSRFKEIWLVNMPGSDVTPFDEAGKISYSYKGRALKTQLLQAETFKKLNLSESDLEYLFNKRFSDQEELLNSTLKILGKQDISEAELKSLILSHQNELGVDYYGIPPLVNSLLSCQTDSLGVPLFSYQSGTYLGQAYAQGSSDATLKKFSNVNLEALWKDFLSAVDEFLLPHYAVPAFQLETTPLPIPQPSQFKASAQPYTSILGHKNTIAQDIAASVKPILKTTSKNIPAGITSKVQEELQIRLTNGYNFDTVGHIPLITESKLSAADAAAVLHGDALVESLTSQGSENGSFSVSTADIRVDGSGQSDMVFLFKSNHARLNSSVLLSYGFKINKLEHSLMTVQVGTTEIPVGQWLSFVNPCKETKEIPLEIPIPLRSFPPTPALPSQQFIACVTQLGKKVPHTFQDQTPLPLSPATDLEKVKSWWYEYTFKYLQASQDTVNVGLIDYQRKTSPPFSMAMSVDNSQEVQYDLFESLLQFQNAYTAIKTDFDTYLNEQNYGSNDAWTAVCSFELLVRNVIRAYQNWPTDKSKYVSESPVLQGFGLDMSKDSENNFEVKLTPQNSDHIPPIEIIKKYHSNAPVSLPGNERNVTFTSENGPGSPSLSYEDGEQVSEHLIRFDQSPLDIMQHSGAKGYISITRNMHLVEGRQTNPDFLYQSPEVSFVNAIYPTLAPNPEFLNLYLSADGIKPKGKHFLAHQLGNFLMGLISPSNSPTYQTVQLEVYYEYTLGSDKKGVAVTLPVIMLPPSQVEIPQALNTPGDLIQQVAEVILAWFQKEKPNENGAVFSFNFSFYTSLNEEAMPFLQLKEVVIDLENLNLNANT